MKPEKASIVPEDFIWKVNLNKADPDELALLRGIGPLRAEAICRYRKEYGPFQRWADLQKVDGIGPKTVERLKKTAILLPEQGDGTSYNVSNVIPEESRAIAPPEGGG